MAKVIVENRKEEVDSHVALWQALATELSRDVVIHVPHGVFARPKHDGAFHVFYWSSPVVSDDRLIVPPTMWGHAVGCTDSLDGFSRWAEAYPIICDEGAEVGGMDADNLFLYWDGCHEQNEDEVKIIAKVIEQVKATFASPQEQRAKAASPEVVTAHDQRLIALCTRKIKEKETVAKSSLDACEREIENTRLKISQLADQVVHHRSVLSAAAQTVAEMSEKMAVTLSKIRELPDIEKLTSSGDVISLVTKKITVTHMKSKKKYELGRFKISVDMHNSTIVMHNMDRLVCTEKRAAKEKLMYAPYVDSNGAPIWSALNVAVAEWFARCDVMAIVRGCLGMLKNVNCEDPWGNKLKRWPEEGEKSEHERPVPVAVKSMIEMGEPIEFKAIGAAAPAPAEQVAQQATAS